MTSVILPTIYHWWYLYDHLWNSESEKSGPLGTV